MSKVSVGDGSLSWLVNIRWGDETSVVGVAHWEVWSKPLVKGALSRSLLGCVLVLAVGSDSLRSEEGFVNVTERVWVHVVFSVVEVSIGIVSVGRALHGVVSPAHFVKTGPLNGVQVALHSSGLSLEWALGYHRDEGRVVGPGGTSMIWEIVGHESTATSSVLLTIAINTLIVSELRNTAIIHLELQITVTGVKPS